MSKTAFHKKVYAFLLKLFIGSVSDETKLILARFIGDYASRNYVGVFREPKIEAFLHDYAKRHVTFDLNRKKTGKIESIVHVFTKTYPVGGHTRIVENLIRLDQNRKHYIIVTEQGETPVNESILELAKNNNTEILFIPDTDLLTKCRQLLQFIDDHGDLVILHHHPSDILPGVALHNFRDKLDIRLMNHADHCFSYGFDVASQITNIRKEAKNITEHCRDHHNNVVLPLPIMKEEFETSPQDDIRTQYGISKGAVIALSIGTAYKFLPGAGYDFFSTMFKGLDQNKDLHLLVVGVSNEDFMKMHPDKLIHPRLKLLGRINDPSHLQAIADIAIDPMPFGSYTALLETCDYGAVPLVCYNAIPLFNLYDDPAFGERFMLDQDEASYLKTLQEYCNNEKKRFQIKKEVAAGIATHHCGVAWLDKYNAVLNNEIKTEPSLKPAYLNRLAQLNESPDQIKYRVLRFMYDNISSFTIGQTLSTVLFQMSNNFSLRETLGILKKRILP